MPDVEPVIGSRYPIDRAESRARLNASTLLMIRFGRSLAHGYPKSDSRDVDEAARDDLAIACKPFELRSGYDDHIRGIVLLNPANNGARGTIFNGCGVAG